MTADGVLPPALRRQASGMVLLVVAAVGAWLLRDSKAGFTNFVMPGDPGPFALPALCLAAIGVTGAGLLALGLATPRQPHGLTGGGAMPLGFVASVLAMPWLMPTIGTAAAVALFAGLWVFVLGSGRPLWRIGQAVAMAAGAAVLAQLIFIRLLNVPLPT